MRLIHTTRLEFEEFFDSQLPKYAILSHCWAKDEVTYQDFLSGAKRDGDGWHKIVKCCQIACKGNLDWAWVDTCCIDKSSTAELSEAINSMYRWYQEAEVCFVFLQDYCSSQEYPPEVAPTSDAEIEPGSSLSDTCRGSDDHKHPIDHPTSPKLRPAARMHSSDMNDPRADVSSGTEGDGEIPSEHTTNVDHEESRPAEDVRMSATISTKLAESRWFTRGWTLQELLAPRVILFYDYAGAQFGSKKLLEEILQNITGISIHFLAGRNRIDQASVSCRMSWASKRQTTRKEDMAYCLLGLFGINMPLLYGEGAGAFQRLQEEIIARNDDHTIFAWTTREQDGVSDDQPSSILARSPEYFYDGAFFVQIGPRPPPSRITSLGIEVSYLRNTVLDIITFGTLQESSGGIALPLACNDMRCAGLTPAQITIRREAIHFDDSSIFKYYRICTASISSMGRLRRLMSRSFRILGESHSSVYMQRQQIASEERRVGGGVTPFSELSRSAWMCVLVCVTIVLLQLPFAGIDRDVVRLWASFGILLLLSPRRKLYLLALVAVSYLPILGGDVVWVAVVTALGLYVCLYYLMLWKVWTLRRNIYSIILERFVERLTLRL